MTASSEMAFTNQLTINAPAARVFSALTEPDHIVKWWGVDGLYHVTEMIRDLRVGGRWKASGKEANGRVFTTDGTYLAIEPPRLLEYTWHYDWDDAAAETVVRFELIESNGSTLVQVTHSGFTSQKARDEHKEGWFAVLGWLAKHVEVVE